MSWRKSSRSAEEPAVAGGRDLDVVDLVALHAGHQGVLAARLDPLHRPAELPGQLRHHDVLGVVHALGAEAAAHVGRRDHAHVVLGQAELRRDHPAVAVHHLHGAPHREPRRPSHCGDQRRAARADARRRARAGRACARRTGAARSAASASPTRCRHSATTLLPTSSWSDRRAGGQGGLDVDHRGQRLVLHADQVERVLRAIDVRPRRPPRPARPRSARARRASGMILHGTGSAGCGA